MNFRLAVRRGWCQEASGEELRKDMPPAQDGVAPESARHHQRRYDPSGKRQISHALPIGFGCAEKPFRTMNSAYAPERSNGNGGLITLVTRTLYNKPTRSYRIGRSPLIWVREERSGWGTCPGPTQSGSAGFAPGCRRSPSRRN